MITFFLVVCISLLHNGQGGCYGSALQAAAYHGNVEAMQLLLDKRAHVNTQHRYYSNALQAAAQHSAEHASLEAIQLLLDKGMRRVDSMAMHCKPQGVITMSKLCGCF